MPPATTEAPPDVAESPSAGWYGPSRALKRVTRRLAADLADHFGRTHVSTEVLGQIRALHAESAAAAHSRAVSPDLADAILACHTALETGERAKLTGEQRKALIASIMVLLERAIPSYDAGLLDVLVAHTTDAYNVAGQEAIERIHLAGTFELKNAEIREELRQRATQHVAYMQKTTRKRVATHLADDLASGASTHAMHATVRSVAESMTGDRADSAADYEAAMTYADAAIDTWGRNGIPYKVWRTTDQPDPHSNVKPCLDNAYAGAIPMLESFPSGHATPPAHNGCQCCVLPAGDPSEAAQAEPWLGA